MMMTLSKRVFKSRKSTLELKKHSAPHFYGILWYVKLFYVHIPSNPDNFLMVIVSHCPILQRRKSNACGPKELPYIHALSES